MKKSLILLSATIGVFTAVHVQAQNENGAGGDMPAYYDHQPLTINFKELPPGGEKAALQHNGSINIIYMSDAGLPGGQPFISVLDAVQGDGFNPLWPAIFAPGKSTRACALIGNKRVMFVWQS